MIDYITPPPVLLDTIVKIQIAIPISLDSEVSSTSRGETLRN